MNCLDAQGQLSGILNDDDILHMTPSTGRLSGEKGITMTDYVHILLNVQFVVLCKRDRKRARPMESQAAGGAIESESQATGGVNPGNSAADGENPFLVLRMFPVLRHEDSIDYAQAFIQALSPQDVPELRTFTFGVPATCTTVMLSYRDYSSDF